MVLRPLAALIVMTAPGPALAETCRYSGTADHGIRMAVTATVTRDRDTITTDMRLDMTGSWWIWDYRYLYEELSTVRGGEVQSIAVNGRTIVDDRPHRQQWDVFVRTPGGLEAQRVQAKSLDSFRIRHPGFVAHWDAAAFGRPWLASYATAPPERRPDLDLPAAKLPPRLRAPIAVAFYWSRFLSPGGQTIPVFLAGFKRDARAELPFRPAVPSGAGRAWTVPLDHPSLSTGGRSTATATILPNGDLASVSFDLHASLGSARGIIRREGCEGPPVRPD